MYIFLIQPFYYIFKYCCFEIIFHNFMYSLVDIFLSRALLKMINACLMVCMLESKSMLFVYYNDKHSKFWFSILTNTSCSLWYWTSQINILVKHSSTVQLMSAIHDDQIFKLLCFHLYKNYITIIMIFNGGNCRFMYLSCGIYLYCYVLLYVPWWLSG